MSAVQTIVEQTKAAATAATLFLKVTIEDYQKKVEEVAPSARNMVTDAVRKVGDTAVGLVKSAKHATHKLDVYSDNMYLIETFNGHLKTVGRKIGKKALLFQEPTAPFENLADNIIDQELTDDEWHTLRAEIIALKDFRDLAMEGSQPKSTRLIAYLKDKVNAGQLAVINAVRKAFGYAPIVLEDLKVDDDDDDGDDVMTDRDVIHNMVAIAFDPFDATNLHKEDITREKLKEEIVKMLKMVYASYKTAIATDGAEAYLFGQIDIVKRADFSMKQLSKVYTELLFKQDHAVLLNQIVELMRNANMTTRNTMDLVKEDLRQILVHLPRDTDDALEAHRVITHQQDIMVTDATDWGGKYMSQRFKHNRIPPIIKALTNYVLSLKGSGHYKNIQDIIKKYNQYIEQIRAARGEIYKILMSRNLMPFLGPDPEAYQVFITYIIHNFIPTRALPGSFVPTETGTILNMVFGEDNNNNNSWDPDEAGEDGMEVQQNDDEVEQEIINAWGPVGVEVASGNTSGNNEQKSMNEAELGGGKRKQTRKRSSKKSKKSKKTKRMKKVKRTMKKNKGKKGKKASRKRR